MSDDLLEDMKDLQDIKKQKRDESNSPDSMGVWEPGRGVKNNRDDKKNVRDQIQ